MSNVVLWHDTAERPHPICQRWGFSIFNEDGKVVYKSDCKYNDAEHAAVAALRHTHGGPGGSNISRLKDGTISKRARRMIDRSKENRSPDPKE